MRIGGNYVGDGACEFCVWAPFASRLSVKIVAPFQKNVPLEKDFYGYWRTLIGHAPPGIAYFYSIEGTKDRPDPASHFQPKGVHEYSQTVDHAAFPWTDAAYKGVNPAEMVIYEIHAGTFTPEGTFDAILPRLDEIKKTGINTIELMPVAQFPGQRNWGYDGAYPFAVQNSYGGPEGFKRLVNACHEREMPVILDVVYNHLGPEGCYVADYGPYLTRKYASPWGDAINFDDRHSDGVRNFFVENALHWFRHYHVDALRLDAIHGIYDLSARPFLQELTESVKQFSRHEKRYRYLIAESDLNDAKVVQPAGMNGFGMDAQWVDDFHHSVHGLITGENSGYYEDFGGITCLAKALREGFVQSGQYSNFRKRRFGNSSKCIPADRLIVFCQNHDQTGNRMRGERLSALASFEALKLAAGTLLLSPFIPLLFMGEEYGEESPFLYFVSHSDPALLKAVSEGRRKEFGDFKWEGEFPEPGNPATFLRSTLRWEKRNEGKHRLLLNLHAELLSLRTRLPALANLDKDSLEVNVQEKAKLLTMKRWKGRDAVFCLFNFGQRDFNGPLPFPEGNWTKLLDSSDEIWGGPEKTGPGSLPAMSFMVFFNGSRRNGQ